MQKNRRNVLKGLGAALASIPFLGKTAQAAPVMKRDSSPYIADITAFAGNFAPLGWVLCNGQLLSITEYEALFTILGTTYGGDGVTTFAVPDLRGRAAMGMGSGPGLTTRVIGEKNGTETVALTTNHLPAHQHGLPSVKMRATGTNTVGLVEGGVQVATASLGTNATAAGTAHNNVQPFLACNYIIAVEGIYPSPS
jgi:microcystin-dependent protein